MPMRTRKLLGTIALLIFIFAYALLAMLAAVVLQVRGLNPAVELAFYVIAGLLWVPPAALIISWMSKSPPSPST